MKRHSRTLRIQDGMILVLAAGLGLSGARLAMNTVQLGLHRGINEAYHPVARDVGVGLAGATTAFAVLVLYVRRADGKFRRRALTPGIIGCCAIVLCVLVKFAWTTEGALFGRPEDGFLFLLLCGFSPHDFSLATTGAWVALLVNGRWRPGDDIVDCAGLLVGVSMILWTTYGMWFPPDG